MKRKIAAIATALVAALTLTGCFKTDSKIVDPKEELEAVLVEEALEDDVKSEIEAWLESYEELSEKQANKDLTKKEKKELNKEIIDLLKEGNKLLESIVTDVEPEDKPEEELTIEEQFEALKKFINDYLELEDANEAAIKIAEKAQKDINLIESGNLFAPTIEEVLDKNYPQQILDIIEAVNPEDLTVKEKLEKAASTLLEESKAKQDYIDPDTLMQIDAEIKAAQELLEKEIESEILLSERLEAINKLIKIVEEVEIKAPIEPEEPETPVISEE